MCWDLCAYIPTCRVYWSRDTFGPGALEIAAELRYDMLECDDLETDAAGHNCRVVGKQTEGAGGFYACTASRSAPQAPFAIETQHERL